MHACGPWLLGAPVGLRTSTCHHPQRTRAPGRRCAALLPSYVRAYAKIGLLWFCPSRYKYQASRPVSRRAYPNMLGMAYATGILPRPLWAPKNLSESSTRTVPIFGASTRFGRLLRPWGSLINHATHSCQINYFSCKDGLCVHARDGRTHAIMRKEHT